MLLYLSKKDCIQLFGCKYVSSPTIGMFISAFIKKSGNMKKNLKDYKNILLKVYQIAFFFCIGNAFVNECMLKNGVKCRNISSKITGFYCSKSLG